MYIFEIVAVTYGTIFDSCLSVFFACSSMSCPVLILCSYYQKKIKQSETMDHAEQTVIKLLSGFESFDKTILYTSIHNDLKMYLWKYTTIYFHQWK